MIQPFTLPSVNPETSHRLKSRNKLQVGVNFRQEAAGRIVLQAAIVLATNLFFRGRWSLEPLSPAEHHLGVLIVFIPPLGGLIVGLLARYGAPGIRGE